MHHGHIAVLLQWAEFVILGGCAVGACIVGNTGPVIKGSIARLLGLLKPNPFVPKVYADLLTMLYEIMQIAAVLGVVITMQSIGGSAAEHGEKVAAALVGTFLGILLAYGIIGPVASAIESRIESEHAYLLCIRSALLAFARGDAPKQTAQAARRALQTERVAAGRIASVRGMADVAAEEPATTPTSTATGPSTGTQ